MADWSNLPEDILLMIAFRLFSVLELLRVRSVCTSWRSSVSVAESNRLLSRLPILLQPLVVTLVTPRGGEKQIYGLDRYSFLSRATFSRVSSSSLSKGWRIKHEAEGLSYGKIRLVNPLSRYSLRNRCNSIDLLKFNVSEIHLAYVVEDQRRKRSEFRYKRLILRGNNQVIGIGFDGLVRYWNGNIWTRMKDQNFQFCDMIVYKGLTYAVDIEGVVWWISSSCGIFRYGPSFHENTNECSWRERRLVECCGEFYIVDRLFEENRRKRKVCGSHPRFSDVIHDDVGNTKCEVLEKEYYPKTVGFKVYKMDEELWKWVQVKSMGDNAFVMATDACFSVMASEFYGCLPNSIYFSEEEEYEMKVCKLDDGSITTMSAYSRNGFEMFVPSFY